MNKSADMMTFDKHRDVLTSAERPYLIALIWRAHQRAPSLPTLYDLKLTSPHETTHTHLSKQEQTVISDFSGKALINRA